MNAMTNNTQKETKPKPTGPSSSVRTALVHITEYI